MRREVELEVVNYRTQDIQLATVEMVTLFAKHSGIAGTNRWMNALLNIQEYFKQGKSHDWSLSAKGLDLTFSGFPQAIPTIEDEEIVFKPREPRFVLEPDYSDLRPNERNQVEKVTGEIAMEMNETYHLGVDYFPTTLIFPKDKYARVERLKAVMM